jgi:hypothetical protein
LLPAGARLTFQIHYTPVGEEKITQTSLGLRFLDEPPEHPIDTRGIATVVFAIPPGDPHHVVEAEYRLPRDAHLLSLAPHMHLRGRAFEYVAEYPDGTSRILLSVPNYDFNWQHVYRFAEPLSLPRRTLLKCRAVYDNSRGNPFNPDPEQTIYFGLQTEEEMMIGYYEILWDQRR